MKLKLISSFSRKNQQQSRKEREPWSKGIANFIAATVEITETTANLPVEEEILLSAHHGRQPAKVLFNINLKYDVITDF